MTYLSDTLSVKKFGNDIWYVNKVSGSDTNGGKKPEDAFETIGAAITALSAGDAISIASGTYTETGLDLDTDNCEMWFELGAILQPATGTALVVSGHYCRVICRDGALLVDPAGANTTGVEVTGNFAYLKDIRVKGDSVIDLGFDLQGGGADLRLCRSSNPLIAAFKIQGNSIKLEGCCTGGTPADTSIGFWVTNSCDKTRLRDCSSQGHATGGFQIDTGCTNGVLKNCSSGGGDGRWSDADQSAVWSNFTYDDMVYHTTDWSVVGGGAASDNMFEITGCVSIQFIYGNVETQMHADVDTLKLEADDGTVQADITINVDPASAPIGSMFLKTKDLGQALTLEESSQIRLNEDSTAHIKGALPFIINGKNGATNYIRCTWTGTGNTGKIHWHCQWEPLTEAGMVVGI